MINAQQSEKKILFMFILILFNSVENFTITDKFQLWIEEHLFAYF